MSSSPGHARRQQELRSRIIENGKVKDLVKAEIDRISAWVDAEAAWESKAYARRCIEGTATDADVERARIEAREDYVNDLLIDPDALAHVAMVEATAISKHVDDGGWVTYTLPNGAAFHRLDDARAHLRENPRAREDGRVLRPDDLTGSGVIITSDPVNMMLSASVVKPRGAAGTQHFGTYYCLTCGGCEFKDWEMLWNVAGEWLCKGCEQTKVDDAKRREDYYADLSRRQGEWDARSRAAAHSTRVFPPDGPRPIL